MSKPKIHRRAFIKTTTLSAAAISLTGAIMVAGTQNPLVGRMWIIPTDTCISSTSNCLP